jgi:amidohydrolase family protein
LSFNLKLNLLRLEESCSKKRRNEMDDQLMLKNVNMIDFQKGAFVNGLDIIIRKGLIKSITKHSPIKYEDLLQIDCSGKYAVPGLFECHAHLCHLATLSEKTKIKALNDFIKKGITQVRDVGGPLSVLQKMNSDIGKGLIAGPEIFYSGPMLEKSPVYWGKMNKTMPGFTVAINTVADASKMVKELKSSGASLVKTFNKFDGDIFKYLINMARDYDLPVTLDSGDFGKPPLQAVTVSNAISQGVKCIEHGKSLWRDIFCDPLQSEYNKLYDEVAGSDKVKIFQDEVISKGFKSISSLKLYQLLDKMADNSVYACPTLHVAKKAVEEAQEERKQTIELMKEMNLFFTKEMIKYNIKLLVGQDGFSADVTLDEMQLLKECGLSEIEIIKGATIYPAKWLGVDHILGTIELEKRANIAVLSDNPLKSIQNMKSVFMVLQNGHVVS